MGPSDVPFGSAGSQLPLAIGPAIPSTEPSPEALPLLTRPTWVTSTFRYHSVWEAHHSGVTNMVFPSGKSTSNSPDEDLLTRPPSPRSSPCGPSGVTRPSIRSWSPLGSGTPLMLGW